jgi:predicted  nucleic acid-binding Zn-ribbon protein
MLGMDRLLELQGIDSSLDRLRARVVAVESGETIASVRTEADQAEWALGEERLRLDEMARDQRRFESEVDSLQQKESAEAKRMFDGSIVNTKELEALQHEIENLKKRRSDREDELLSLMEQREELEALAVASETKATGLRATAETDAAAADVELVEARAELERLTAARADLLPKFDPDLLERYDDLRRLKKGVGAAALVDGVCQGCHEQLSPVEVDRLKRADGIRRCDHCRRILVF